jgi:sulfide:quinone oxidoreductase
MEVKRLTESFSASPQVEPKDLPSISASGFRAILCNRPNGESPDQPSFEDVRRAAAAVGIEARYVPVTSGKINDADVHRFATDIAELPKPVLAYCRTGTRSATLWSLSEARNGRPRSEILGITKAAGYEVAIAPRPVAIDGGSPAKSTDARYSVVIVGAGAAGIAAASSLKARKPDLEIALIDPADMHYYQPGWTLVGAGVFEPDDTARTMASLIPDGVKWIKAAVVAFEPDRKVIVLEGGRAIGYDRLIVAPGLKLNWAAVEGLTETLGRNGVTSNYRFDLAPYTWQLVRELRAGRAVFTQPPMPIKCAGAPQKALYLSADHWRSTGCLDRINIDFYNAGGVLFGVKEYVPPLMEYINRYNAHLQFNQNLKRIDGPAKRAWFAKTAQDGTASEVEAEFDMIHVCPPQQAPDFVRSSPLADAAGWVEVDQMTLQHKRFADIYSLGDVCGAPNAKTAAAARKQAPIVAHNLLRDMGFIKEHEAVYDGYGSCPLTVERGKILLAEFGYGGKLLPSFPAWFIDGTKPSYAAWLLKERMLPQIYWNAMLKGREWMAKPKIAA